MDKFDDDLFIVQTAVEIEYVRFQVNAVVFLERRAPADIGHAVKDFFADPGPHGIDTQRWNHAVLNKNIGRWKTELFSPAVAVHDLSHDGDPASQKFGGLGQFAFADQLPDQRTADLLFSDLDRIDDSDLESVFRPRLLKIFQSTFPALAETKIISNVNFLRMNTGHDVTADKLFRGQPGEAAGKVDDDARFRAELFDEFESMLEGNDIGQSQFRAKHMHRMRPERHHQRLSAELSRPSDGPLDQGLMPAMHAVKNADGQDGVLEFLSNLSNCVYDVHLCLVNPQPLRYETAPLWSVRSA